MKSTFRILCATLLLPAAIAPAAHASGLILAGICLPLTSRYTKCVDGKVAECIRTRNVTCKTKLSCTPTQQSCDLPAVAR
ncbi:MAG: hypothetical protein ACLP7P_20450 [Rhodomicrobium sp.]